MHSLESNLPKNRERFTEIRHLVGEEVSMKLIVKTILEHSLTSFVHVY